MRNWSKRLDEGNNGILSSASKNNKYVKARGCSTGVERSSLNQEVMGLISAGCCFSFFFLFLLSFVKKSQVFLTDKNRLNMKEMGILCKLIGPLVL